MDVKAIVVAMKENKIMAISIENGRINVTYAEEVFNDKPVKPTPTSMTIVPATEETQTPVDGFSVADVAELIGLCPNSVVNKIKQGLLQAVKHGKSFVVTSDSVDAYLKTQQIPAGWLTCQEMAEKFGYAKSYIANLAKQYGVHVKQLGVKRYYDAAEFEKHREAYELDILKNDGHRKGPVRFKND